MKLSHYLVALSAISSIVLTGCSDSEAVLSTAVEQTPRVVKLSSVAKAPDFQEFAFPAVVSAVKTVDVSFEVTGRLMNEALTTGKQVKKGELLAALDPKPFERKVKEQRTRRAQALRELKRIRTMHQKKLVPQSQLDAAKTDFELAEIELSNAIQDLEYATLTAPFDAQISQRFVDNNSYVTAGTSIAQLQDLSLIYFTLHVPERVMSRRSRDEPIKAQATLLSNTQQWFDVHYVEHSTQPDPVTQTYQVVFAMQPIEGSEMTPGTRARVKIMAPSLDQQGGVLVPVTALVSGPQQNFWVWRYDQQQQRVDPVKVSVAQMLDRVALVKGDLEAEQLVVAAGATKMEAGMRVKPFVEVN